MGSIRRRRRTFKTRRRKRRLQAAQRAGVTVYVIYHPSADYLTTDSSKIYSGQVQLAHVADETGGEAYFLGFGPLPSLAPFLADMTGSPCKPVSAGVPRESRCGGRRAARSDGQEQDSRYRRNGAGQSLGSGGRRLNRWVPRSDEEASVKGILKLAYKLLVNDKAKFTALLVGITFAVFLMIAMTSLFAGVLNRASATVINLGASMWIMDPSVQTVANTIGMPDYVLDAARSMQGVNYAVPVYSGGALVKLADGTYQAVTVVGLDDTSLFGRPQLLQGKIEDIYGENAFIVVKDPEFPKLENPHVGTEFEVNDHRGVIVGIANGGQQRPVRRSDALHDLRKSASIHSESALHDLLRSGRSPRAPRT